MAVMSDERTKSGVNNDDLFPALDDLPPLSGKGSGIRSPRPAVGEDPLIRPAPRTAIPRSNRDPRVEASGPADPFGLDPRDERRSPGNEALPPSGVGDGFPPDAVDAAEANDALDWTAQHVSIADIDIGREWQFKHGTPSLTEAEEDSYVDLVRAAIVQRSLASGQLPAGANLTSAWETAFYRFAEVRKRAWENGKLSLRVSTASHSDAFPGSNSRVLSPADNPLNTREVSQYSLQVDMQSHPDDFVGRPIVLYGLFTPLGSKDLQARTALEFEERTFTLQRGILKTLTGNETIAMVDAIGYVDPQSQNKPSTAWPVEERVAVPVMIKGWFVKLWQHQPLVFTDKARILTPRPYDEYIRDHVRSKRRVSDDESWIYYETLRQLQVTSANVQAAIALKEQNLRVKELLLDIQEKAAADRLVLENQLRNGAITRADDGKKEGYETRLTRLKRQLSLRKNRYLECQNDPESFPLFVDVFQHADYWQGRLVTLRGHVRRVTTYSGDSTLFDGQPLHELWLFTDDSQQNPAVIVTPSLPKDFPVASHLIDSVTVTGCFLKMYVYRSQQENRVAPLVLAGHVSWNPTADQVIALAKEGYIPAKSELLAKAKGQGRSLSDTMVLLLGFLALLVSMTVWARVQRDRREQRRLMTLVDERPDFRQTSPEIFSGPFADPRIEPTRG